MINLEGVGINRRVDKLGRIVIPKELRKIFQINYNEFLEVIGTEEGILIRKPNYELRRIEHIEDNYTDIEL